MHDRCIAVRIRLPFYPYRMDRLSCWKGNIVSGHRSKISSVTFSCWENPLPEWAWKWREDSYRRHTAESDTVDRVQSQPSVANEKETHSKRFKQRSEAYLQSIEANFTLGHRGVLNCCEDILALVHRRWQFDMPRRVQTKADDRRLEKRECGCASTYRIRLGSISFSLITAQLVKESSSVGHLAAVSWKDWAAIGIAIWRRKRRENSFSVALVLMESRVRRRRTRRRTRMVNIFLFSH